MCAVRILLNITKSLDTPFMFMNSEFTSALQFVNQKLREYMMARANTDVYNITVSGSIHEDFTEFPLLFPLFRKTIGPPESIDSQKMLKIMNAYTLAFFNKYLKGIDSPLLDGPSPDFPEVIIKTGNQ